MNSLNHLLKSALVKLFLKNICSRHPVVFPESSFQSETVSLGLPRNHETSPVSHHHLKHHYHYNFQHLLQNTHCKMIQNRMKEMKEMNLILTLLIMAVTVVTMIIKCTPDHPKHRALNSLHDMAYY